MSTNRFPTRPLHLQVRDVLMERIASGAWRPGAVLPNEGDLARELGVSLGSLRRALDILEGESVLTRKVGYGAFVNEPGAGGIANRCCNAASGRVNLDPITECPADELERERLGLQAHCTVYRVRRLRYRDGRPFMLEKASLPADLFPNLLERQNAIEQVTLLAQRYGIALGKAEERLSVVKAETGLAETLDVAARSPVVVLDRVIFTLDGRAAEWRVAYCSIASECAAAMMR